VSQGTLRRNNGFFTVDMERLAQDDPILLREVTSEVLELLSSRAYRAPTPLTPFPMSRLSDAMDVLRTGRHTGKVVLLNETMEEGDTQPQYVTVPCHVSPLTMIRPDGLYLVTGGAGGFGSCIVRRLADLGATRIVVTVTTDPGYAQFQGHALA
jgi:NADPH:quinone reductase-like Zn-dependent oxidoreductase